MTICFIFNEKIEIDKMIKEDFLVKKCKKILIFSSLLVKELNKMKLLFFTC